MDLNRYRFTSRWRLDAPPERVFAVLREPEGYPRWWREIRSVRRIDEHSGEVVARSLLPYDLVLRAHEGREDPDSGVIEISLSGDLEGFCRWTVRSRADGGGAEAVFRQEVVVRKPLLRRLAIVARPALLANHALMMRSGRRGLRAALSRDVRDQRD